MDDIDVLEAQAERLASVWTGLRMQDGDVVVLLTDPAPHEEALRALLQHPERVRFRRSAYTRLELEEVHRQMLEAIGQGTARTHGPGLEQANVTLRSGEAVLAEQLHQRFGDRLEITLGLHRYPLDSTRVLEPPRLPVATVELPGVTAVAELDRPTWAPGEDITGHVRLVNRGPTAVSVAGGFHAVGILLDGAGRPVGQSSGMMAMVLVITTVEPGREGTVRFVAGSDTSDPRLGVALPPGAYQLVVPLTISDRPDTQHGGPRGRGDIFITEPVAVRLDQTNP